MTDEDFAALSDGALIGIALAGIVGAPVGVAALLVLIRSMV